MPKLLLAISHSTGDSQIILECAKALIRKNVHTHILTVGKDAQAELAKDLPAGIQTISLDTLLPAGNPVANRHLFLTPLQIKTIADQLKLKDYVGLLVGTPSYIHAHEQCEIPEQLVAYFSTIMHHINPIVASDYLFFDPKHRLAQRRSFEWAKFFMVPSSKAAIAYQVDPQGPTVTAVVGHPSLDAGHEAVMQLSQDPTSLQKLYTKLNHNPGQKSLLYLAGGKAGDQPIIKAVLEAIKRYPDVSIVIGLHPRAELAYIVEINDLIRPFQQVSIVKGLTSNELIYAADAILTGTSTVGSIAAICGKPAGFYQQDVPLDDPSWPFTVAEGRAHAYNNPKGLTQLFDLARKNKPGYVAPLSKEPKAAELMAEVVIRSLAPQI
jgi:hypothetical protein